MKTKLSTLILLLSCVVPLFSQLSGIVTDINNNAIEFANVALYELPDSTEVKYGAVTDSAGFYRFSEAIPVGNYQLRVSFLGFRTAVAFVWLNEQNKNEKYNFTLQPDETVLNELMVEGRRPAMKVEAGKFTYHIPTLLKDKPVTNAYDALKEIPGVMEQNEQITLLGTSGMTILLNGQKTSMTYTQLMTLLRSIPSSMIEDVEIMYSAPPQYNIRGAAINVVLKQQGGEDKPSIWQGEITSEYRLRTHASGIGSASMVYQGKSTMVDALYSYGNYKTFNAEELKAEHVLNGIIYNIQQHSEGINKYQSHNVRMALQQTFNNKDKANISYTGMFDETASTRTASTDISGSITDTKTGTSGPSSMHNIKADYSAHFGLNLGADYTLYDDGSDYFLENALQTSSAQAEKLSYQSKQEVRRMVFYTNQSHSLKNNWSVNYGFNYSGVDTKNRSDVIKDGSEFEDATFNTQQQERIWSFFGGFSKSFSEKLSIQASLAAEYYHATETSGNAKNMLWDDVAWFPTLNASYNASPDHIFQLAVSSDKTYPSYWSLNPNVYYFSSYGVTYGNPRLRPMRNYSMGLTYIYKQKYVIRPYVNYIPDYFVQLPYQSREKLQQEFMEQNYTFRQNIGLLGVVPFKIGDRISSRLVANVMYWHEKDDEFFDISFDRKTVMGIFQMNHDITLSVKPDLKMNVSGYVTTPTGIQGIYDLGASGDLSSGITWTFDKQRARIILKADDIFNTRTPIASVDYKGQKSSLNAFRDTRTISVSFVYRFGGYKDIRRKEVDTSRFGTK
ncbi:MAG: TonB-dependent receptor [Bacteroidia bacterium]|nr:TonB-dependent receptor [Bacteroidia bacterium]